MFIWRTSDTLGGSNDHIGHQTIPAPGEEQGSSPASLHQAGCWPTHSHQPGPGWRPSTTLPHDPCLCQRSTLWTRWNLFQLWDLPPASSETQAVHSSRMPPRWRWCSGRSSWTGPRWRGQWTRRGGSPSPPQLRPPIREDRRTQAPEEIQERVGPMQRGE